MLYNTITIKSMTKKHFIFLSVILCFGIYARAQRLQPVAWNQLTNVTENEELIINTASSSGSAVSDNQSEYGESGYLEFTANEINKTKSIGLNILNNTGAITHCFKFVNNTVAIYNGSTLKLAAYSFNKGDQFKIEYTGSYIRFYHNGTLKSSYSYSNTVYFRIKAILDNQNASFSGVKTTMPVIYTLSKTSGSNYIHTISPLEAVSSVSFSGERKTGQYIEEIGYFDGLGRPVQTVIPAQSPMLRDEVQPVYYDSDGLMSKEYLPYTVKYSRETSSPINKGALRSSPYTEQAAFFNNYFPTDKNWAYSDVAFEESPLNRVLEKTGSGADWKGKLADALEKPVTYEYGGNTNKIMLIEVDEAVSPVKFYLENEYAPYSLFLTRTIDENGNKTEEYTDKSGRVVLKRAFLGTKTVSTYYVYDDFGLLRLVVQPKGSSQLETSFVSLAPRTKYYIPDGIFYNNCFYYAYDSKHRIKTKHIPASTVKVSGEIKGAVKMIYNKRDQLILSQDGNLESQNKWKFTKYDELNRPVMTGIYTHSSSVTQEQMQANADNAPLQQFEARISSGHGYTTGNSYPSSNLEIQSVTYYDDYNYPVISGYAYKSVSGFSNNPYTRVEGKITGQKVNVLGSSKYLYTVNYYNDYGQLIQSQSTNNLSGTDVVTTEYSFTGKVTMELLDNTAKLSGETTKNYKLKKRMVYDHADRLVDTYEKVNNEAEVQLSRVTYNENGAMKEKNQHITATKPAIQSIDYSYNIKGWLTGINNTSLNDGEGDIFGMQLMYNDLGNYASGNSTKKQYNGNISAIEWYGTWNGSSSSFTGKHANVYQYDGMNRLLNAWYYRNAARNTGFDFAASYDDNGNILTMQQNASDYGQIDNLSYSYMDGGNKLRAVGDAASDVANRGDFFENSGYEGTTNTEYVYDANGNMTEDKNRNIKIQYNELNLPTLVTIGTNTVRYQYDALGKKLKKTVNNSINTHYCGEIIYSDNDMLYAANGEGQIVKDGSVHRYEYFMKDHLGNIRMTYSDLGANGTADKMQEDSYYPYGLKMPGFTSLYSGYSGNKYLYNGKEIQDDIPGFGFYDYGARMYDPQIARYQVIDRFSEKHYPVSPYHYANNNPVYNIDINGDWFSGSTDWLDRIHEYFQNQITSKQNQIQRNEVRRVNAENEGNDKKAARLENRIQRQENQLAVLNTNYSNVKAEINIMASSSQEYHINSSFGNEGAVGFDWNTKAVNINFNSASTNALANFAHELKHGFQFETGKISLIPNTISGGDLYDTQDEVEAYQRMQAFGMFSGQTINANWVTNRGKNDGAYQTIQGRVNQITVDSQGAGVIPWRNIIRTQINAAGKSAAIPPQVIIHWQTMY